MDALIISYGTASPGACLVRRRAVSGVRFESEYLEDTDWARLFPDNAVGGLFRDAGMKGEELGNVVMCGKPFSVFERLLNVHMFFFPRYFGAFVKDLTGLFSEKLAAGPVIRKKTGFRGDILFLDPMDVVAAARAAFLDEGGSAVVSFGDHVGARSLGIYRKSGGALVLEKELTYPYALSVMCDICASSGEEADIKAEDAVRVDPDGSFSFNGRYFSYSGGKIKLAPGVRIARKDAEKALLGVMKNILAAAAPRGGKVMFISDHDVPERVRAGLSAVFKGLIFNHVGPADILKEAASRYIEIMKKKDEGGRREQKRKVKI